MLSSRNILILISSVEISQNFGIIDDKPPNSGRKSKTKKNRESQNVKDPEESEVQLMLLKVSNYITLISYL